MQILEMASIVVSWTVLSFLLGMSVGYDSGTKDTIDILVPTYCETFCEWRQVKFGEIQGECGFQNISKTCEEWLNEK